MHFSIKYSLFYIILSVAAFVFGAYIALTTLFIIDLSKIIDTNHAQPSILLDCNGHEWTRFSIDYRKPIAYHEIPSSIINAFIAIEDRHFFSHVGLSLKGIVRSMMVNLRHGKFVQGASTITQQLIKLVFLHNKKTWQRKIQEQWYALAIENIYTKEQILEAYLNNAYFGQGIYGIQAASDRFFGKDLNRLTLAQSALLAGIVRSPNKYCPLNSLSDACTRRNIVLKSMLDCSMITKEEYTNAIDEALVLADRSSLCNAPHLKESLRLQLIRILGNQKALYTGGFIIQTTLDPMIQQNAVQIFKTECKQLRNQLQIPIDGALMTISTQTGAIRALVGGYDFDASQFNRALQTNRQIGSTIKPLIYASALMQGLSLQDVIIDEPTSFTMDGKIWQPRNYDKKFNGPITRAYALARSNNIVAIKTLLAIDAEPIVQLAQNAGFQKTFHTYPSLALGCIDATLKEVIGMFNIFANDGVFVEPHAIAWIKNNTGEKIWHHQIHEQRVMPSTVTAQIGSVLQYSFEHIYKQQYKASVRSKTGTTNDSRTCWFVGSTPEYTTGVYIGCDDNRPMGDNVYPIRTALPIWQKVHATLPANQTRFYVPPELRTITIHKRNGCRIQHPHADVMDILV